MSIPAFTTAMLLASTQANPSGPPPVAPVAQANVQATPAAADQQAPPPAAPVGVAAPTEPAAPSSPAPASPAPASSDQAAYDDSIVVTARPRRVPGDPLQTLNVETFAAIQSVDKAFTGPVARAYKKSLPGPVRSGLRNFLSNLQEPVVFLNYMLQLKPGKGAETVGRFLVNSTIGGAGLFDVAKKRPFNLPHRANGFAYTLGYYGVGPGPFMYLPLIGPTTLRDIAGRFVDLSVLPFAIGKPFSQPAYAIPTTTIRLLDERAEAEDDVRALRASSADPYSTIRENYLRTRQAEIDALHGRHHDADSPAPQIIAPVIDPYALPASPGTVPDAASSPALGQSPIPIAPLPDLPALKGTPQPAGSNQITGSDAQPPATPDQPALQPQH